MKIGDRVALKLCEATTWSRIKRRGTIEDVRPSIIQPDRMVGVVVWDDVYSFSRRQSYFVERFILADQVHTEVLDERR
jgi:hypothetical protein